MRGWGGGAERWTGEKSAGKLRSVPTVPLETDNTSAPMARGRAVGRPVMRTRKYFLACKRR